MWTVLFSRRDNYAQTSVTDVFVQSVSVNTENVVAITGLSSQSKKYLDLWVISVSWHHSNLHSYVHNHHACHHFGGHLTVVISLVVAQAQTMSPFLIPPTKLWLVVYFFHWVNSCKYINSLSFITVVTTFQSSQCEACVDWLVWIVFQLGCCWCHVSLTIAGTWVSLYLYINVVDLWRITIWLPQMI